MNLGDYTQETRIPLHRVRFGWTAQSAYAGYAGERASGLSRAKIALAGDLPFQLIEGRQQ
jgi:hypothetical protein